VLCIALACPVIQRTFLNTNLARGHICFNESLVVALLQLIIVLANQAYHNTVEQPGQDVVHPSTAQQDQLRQSPAEDFSKWYAFAAIWDAKLRHQWPYGEFAR